MENKILETIKNSDIHMKPRWHFILKAVLMTVAAFILLFLIIYLVSFIIFIERQTGMKFWLLIVLSVIFVVALERIICSCSLSYRRPFLYSMLAIAILICAGTLAVISIRFHERFAGYAPVFYHIYIQSDIR